MSLIRFPSVDGPQFDFFAQLPPNMTAAKAKRLADEIIMMTNFEFMDDGGDSSIHSTILERLNVHGFTTFLGAQIDAMKTPAKPLNDGHLRTSTLRQEITARIAVQSIEWDAPYRPSDDGNSASYLKCAGPCRQS